MDLRQIECVLAVSELGSFTRAAESLYVTQSSLSYTVGRIERELGVQLFARSGRRVVLTPAGEAFLPHARESLVAARAAREAACAVGGIVTGQLRVAVTPTLKRFAAETLADLRAKHPEVRISLTVGHPSAVVELVRTADPAQTGVAEPGQVADRVPHRPTVVDPHVRQRHAAGFSTQRDGGYPEFQQHLRPRVVDDEVDHDDGIDHRSACPPLVGGELGVLVGHHVQQQ